MKDRIKLIMEQEGMTPAKFADRLHINRAVISHILNGRNNPSLEVVSKILTELNYINAEWLINGSGEMYKKPINKTDIRQPDLFHETEKNTDNAARKVEELHQSGVKTVQNNNQHTDNKEIELTQNNVRKISQIIVYYDDNTFEIFGPYH